MRSLLFVPGDSERKLIKCVSVPADVLLVDLEDAIAPQAKAEARKTTMRFLSGLADRSDLPPIYVRINDLSTEWAAADLEAVVSAAPDGIMLPKAGSGEEVRALAERLESFERKAGVKVGSLGLIVLAGETPGSALRMESFESCGPRLKALTWGAEDLSAVIGASRNREDDNKSYTAPYELVRSLCVIAAAAAGVPAIDTVYTDFKDDAGLERECMRAVRDGFVGKLCIHPAQVPIINSAFTPSRESIRQAHNIVAAFEASANVGVVSLDGKMLDRPHLDQARRILARAKLAGAD